MPRQSIFNMSLSKIYPMLVQKAERKNRTQAEVNQIIRWLAGYTQTELETQLSKDVTYQTFFEEAPQMNPNCNLITGVVCGVRVEAIEDPLMQKKFAGSISWWMNWRRRRRWRRYYENN